MRTLKLSLASALLLAGCSQILGLGDYEIDKTLDGDSSHGGAADDGGSGGKNSSGGKANDAGKTGTEAGEGPVSNGGKNNDTGGTAGTGNTSAGEGGEPPAPQGGAAGTGPVGEGGAGGDGGAPPVPGPVLIPCDSVTCCTSKGGTPDAGVELLKDGGFEAGTALDGATPWTETSTGDYPLITDGTVEKASPHKGTYFAFLAGVKDETSILESETFNVPADAGWLVLSYYRKFQLDSAASDTANGDLMGISLYEPGTDDLITLLSYWDKDEPGATSGWLRTDESVSAKDDAGQERYLLALGSTDAHVTDADLASTNYMIDDLSLKAFRCYQ